MDILAGIRVIEIGQNLAAPFGAEILAHLGADVIKVERPSGGDDGRIMGPPFFGETASMFHAVNINKRGITLDIKDESDRERLHALIASADVVIQNLRPGVLDALGLDGEAVLKRHPRIVYASVRAFGPDGPRAMSPGYEPMVQAFSGLMLVSGDEDSPPTRIGTQVLDHGTGMWTAIGCLAGLWARQSSGRGMIVDTSLLDTALAWLTVHFAAYRASGQVPARHRAGHASVAPLDTFETQSRPVYVAAANDRLFVKLAGALGRPDLIDDPRFARNAARVQNRAALMAELRPIFMTADADAWAARLEAAGVPSAPINRLSDVADDPQVAANGILMPVPGLEADLVGLPIRFDGHRPTFRRRAPSLGEHNDEVLASAKSDAAE